jgi:hypothetical protein
MKSNIEGILFAFQSNESFSVGTGTFGTRRRMQNREPGNFEGSQRMLVKTIIYSQDAFLVIACSYILMYALVLWIFLCGDLGEF